MTNPAEGGERVDTVTIVGGGDAGLLTSLLLKQFNPEMGITVVDNFAENIPEVGKSTIPYILKTFHNVLGIDGTRFVSKVKPVWKASVYFEDWCGDGPFHVPFDDFAYLPQNPGRRRFEELYYRYENEAFHTLDVELAERQLSPFIELLETGEFRKYDHMAYHLGTDRLNDFLRVVCRERGIQLIDDEIIDVRTENNHIASVASDTAEYEADLYVDATGFKRTLMQHLDNEFTAFDFPLDSALVAKADLDLSEIYPATVINSGDAGWFWQIDTYDWRDLGYVYSSDHLSTEEAIAEFIDSHDGDVAADDIKQYRFESGAYEDAWVNNCLAMGNALGFVEPLQSTALTLNAILAEKASELLTDHHRLNHDGLREIYNNYARGMWSNVRDFVCLHYQYSSGDNEFWTDMQSVTGTEQLPELVRNYQENGFSSHEEYDRRYGPTPRIFNQYIFYRVLRSLGVDSAFYESVDIDVGDDVKENIENQRAQIEQDATNHLTYEDVYTRSVFQ